MTRALPPLAPPARRHEHGDNLDRGTVTETDSVMVCSCGRLLRVALETPSSPWSGRWVTVEVLSRWLPSHRRARANARARGLL